MNHPHESQAAAMARAGELPDGEQLRECINSGQVSAAQVVAHQEAGELPISAWFYECFDGTTLARTKDDKPADDGEPLVKLSDATAALAAERAEVARLREALTRSMTALDDWTALYAPDMCSEEHVQAAHDRINEIGTLGYIADIQEKNAAALAPGEKHD